MFFEILGCIKYLLQYGDGQNIKGLIYNTITWHFNNGVNWFLATMFISELLFWAMAKRINKPVCVYIMTILVILLSSIMPLQIHFYKNIGKIIYSILFLLVGYVFSKKILESNKWVLVITLGAICIIAIVNSTTDMNNMSLNNPLLFMVGALCGTYFVLQSGKLLKSNLLKYIGKNSLIIFGTHNLIYVPIGHCMGIQDFADTSLIQGIIIIIAVIIIELPIIYILTRFTPFLIGKKLNTNNVK